MYMYIVRNLQAFLLFGVNQNSHIVAFPLIGSEKHLTLATKERSYYRSVCDNSKQQVSIHFTVNSKFSPPAPFSSPEPCSFQSMVHYSFDMAALLI